jgi:two-component system, OmpR family, osmolarity sensor histidine kinase EnvZ
VTLLPGSLLWRTLIALLAALMLSQATALWLFEAYFAQPRSARTAMHFLNHLKTIRAALMTGDEAHRAAFLAHVDDADGLRVVPATGNEAMSPARGGRTFAALQSLVREGFGERAEILARPGDDRGDGTPRELWIRLPAGEREFWVVVPRTRVETDTATALVLWSVVVLAIALLATFLLMWHLNRPLGELARAAAKLGRGGEPEPVTETGPAEIRAVARAFNGMTRDLRRNARERATFLAGISHDLRTPIARLRLDVEMLEGKVDPSVQRGMVSDLEDMNAIIDQFIDFTRTESAEPLAPVDLAELARACAERAQRSGAAVRCELAPTPVLMLRPLAMRRLVDNLLVNAARHAGGEVVLRTAVEGRSAILSVLDRGPGIPAALVEHLKEPFTRLDAARSGSSGAGLGLAIANRVAQVHGGRLDLLPREGGGLEARVVLEISGPGAVQRA